MTESLKMTGQLISLGDLLDGSYKFEQFHIPPFQRPYAWTTDQTEQLFDDLLNAFNATQDDNLDEEYFLGTIILAKNKDKGYDVIDGQQRLTTLTILYSVLASNVDDEMRDDLKNKLYQKGDKSKGLKSCPRLLTREGKGDRAFFEKYVQKIATDKLLNLKDEGKLFECKTDSQKNVAENAILLQRKIKDKINFSDQDQIDKFVQFITQKVALMVVTTSNQETAIRIFSVMNNRGLDLQICDVFKAEVLEKIEDEDVRDEYAQKWEDLEDLVGRDNFDQALSHVCTIKHPFTKNETVLDYLRQKVLGNLTPQTMIDDVLEPCLQAYAVLTRRKDYKASEKAEEVNCILGYLRFNKNDDWIPPAILIYIRYKNSPEKLLAFLKKLELLAAFLNASGKNIGQRLQRYQPMLLDCANEIAKDEDFERNLTLTNDEITEFYKVLDGDVYLLQKDRRKALLLRVDSLISDGLAKYDYGLATVEHVLPQTPKEGSQWLKDWPEIELREKWVHRLPNLVLLSRSKNSKANNFDFDVKKEKYFENKSGSTSYSITASVLKEKRWTPDVVEKRRRDLLDRVCQKWGITPSTNVAIAPSQNPKPPLLDPSHADIFYAKSNKIKARGYFVGGKSFVVLKGSEVAPPNSPYTSSAKKKREELEKTGVIKEDRFLVDYKFETPSGAADLVSGGSQNGWTFWVRNDGVALNVYRNPNTAQQ